MSVLLSLFGGFWSKTVGIVAAVIGGVLFLFGLRAKIRAGAREDMRDEIQRRTIERIEVSQKVARDVDELGGDDILDKLRDNGWIRD